MIHISFAFVEEIKVLDLGIIDIFQAFNALFKRVQSRDDNNLCSSVY